MIRDTCPACGEDTLDLAGVCQHPSCAVYRKAVCGACEKPTLDAAGVCTVPTREACLYVNAAAERRAEDAPQPYGYVVTPLRGGPYPHTAATMYYRKGNAEFRAELEGGTVTPLYTAPPPVDARTAERWDALQMEVAALRAALTPFAEAAVGLPARPVYPGREAKVFPGVSPADFRAAAFLAADWGSPAVRAYAAEIERAMAEGGGDAE